MRSVSALGPRSVRSVVCKPLISLCARMRSVRCAKAPYPLYASRRLGARRERILLATEARLLWPLFTSRTTAVGDIKKAAEANGVSWPTIERAQANVRDIVADQAGKLRQDGILDEDSKARGWYWLRQKPPSPYQTIKSADEQQLLAFRCWSDR